MLRELPREAVALLLVRESIIEQHEESLLQNCLRFTELSRDLAQTPFTQSIQIAAIFLSLSKADPDPMIVTGYSSKSHHRQKLPAQRIIIRTDAWLSTFFTN